MVQAVCVVRMLLSYPNTPHLGDIPFGSCQSICTSCQGNMLWNIWLVFGGCAGRHAHQFSIQVIDYLAFFDGSDYPQGYYGDWDCIELRVLQRIAATINIAATCETCQGQHVYANKTAPGQYSVSFSFERRQSSAWVAVSSWSADGGRRRRSLLWRGSPTSILRGVASALS